MATADTVFDLLSDERRRYALYYLHEQSGPVSIDELVETVRTWENDPPTQNALEEVDALKVELQHHHLPKTAEVEFVQYQPEQGVIQVEGTSPEIDALVTIARVIEQPEDG